MAGHGASHLGRGGRGELPDGAAEQRKDEVTDRLTRERRGQGRLIGETAEKRLHPDESGKA